MEFKEFYKNWAITLKPQLITAIKNGSKKYEIRTRKPNDLRPLDTLFIVQSASGGKVVGSVKVEAIFSFRTEYAWRCFNSALDISKEAFDEYAKGKEEIVLIRIGKFEEVPEKMTIDDLGLKKAPQWFARVK